MDKQYIRLGLLVAVFIVGMMLFNTWQQEKAYNSPSPTTVTTAGVAQSSPKASNDLPTMLPAATNTKQNSPAQAAPAAIDPSRIITVTTDVYNVQIDAMGGDIIYLNLPQYPETLNNKQQGFVLLDRSPERFYIIQTGLLNDNGPDSNASGRVLYRFAANNVRMGEDESVLNLDLKYTTRNGVNITKRFIFTRDNYVIAVQYIIENHSGSAYLPSMFGRIKRSEPKEQRNSFFGTMRYYTGAAINTPAKKYQKLSFSDMAKKPFKEDVMGGWAGMVEHYFATALVPSPDQRNYYQTEDFGKGIFGISFVSSADTVAPGATQILETRIYAGPEIADNLKAVAPGLELTIDYGMLWFLCQPIFWLLKTMFSIFSNWGVAIIFTTIIIKALFYRLSASSYKSMGNMRKLQPKIEALKQRHGDDRQKFSQAMMELYKKEKVNPLGGCLPILVQIPVFIALYYVLLEAVQLRQAPFMLWITDLSAKDPYYVLPIIMGISMFVQQRLNPTPPDPIQAKVMMFMPLFFTFLFLQFPSGLVLYWVVNNLLSILQQWMITRRIEKSVA